MVEINFPILTIITFLPLVGVFILVFLNRKYKSAINFVTLITSSVVFLVSLFIYFYFREGTAEFQFVENIPWIPQWGASYHIGVDGLSLFLVLLTTFLTPITILSAWNAIENKLKEFMICMLLLETGMLGVFVSLDLLLFYIFWEAMLIPMYLLIGVWGGPQRVYAAVKFILYTMAGSVLMLIAIIYLYYYHGKITNFYTFDLIEIYKVGIPYGIQLWLFLAFSLSFAIKVPMFPFHTWLPDAHVEAPTAGSVILAAILLKMGTYGFVRFSIPLFPEAAIDFIPIISILAIIGIIYGALVAMVQPDIKSLVAYSSVSHLGLVMLGLFALNHQGIEGGIMQMINHGLSTGALFLIVGMIYERRHTRMIEDFGGLSRQVPVFAAFFMIVTLSSIGLPGLNGFIGEFLVLVGTFKSNVLYAILGATGVILSAVYMLWMFQRVMFGEIKHEANKRLKDLSLREKVVLIPIIIAIFWIGLYPQPLLKRMEPSVTSLIERVNKSRTATVKLNPDSIKNNIKFQDKFGEN